MRQIGSFGTGSLVAMLALSGLLAACDTSPPAEKKDAGGPDGGAGMDAGAPDAGGGPDGGQMDGGSGPSCGTTTCQAGEYCKVQDCTEDPATAVCEAMPETCSGQFDPQCGCDGKTYANACYAAQEGVSIRHPGECSVAGDPCGGSEQIGCNDATYCKIDDCSVAGATGTCETKPATCPIVFAPVCGCDGITYPNACEALRAGVSVLSDGDCPGGGIPCGGPNQTPCPTGAYCAYEDCTAASPAGFCKAVPNTCTGVVDEVCGCDGVTYQNACFAAQAGVTVLYQGACAGEGDACGGIAGIVCGPGLYCDYPGDTCGDNDALGTCTAAPASCSIVVNSVCGCDGMTYQNACFAAQAGTDVRHTGPCN